MGQDHNLRTKEDCIGLFSKRPEKDHECFHDVKQLFWYTPNSWDNICTLVVKKVTDLFDTIESEKRSVSPAIHLWDWSQDADQ